MNSTDKLTMPTNEATLKYNVSSIGERIKTLRKKKGISQEILAQLLSYSCASKVSRWESGDSEPTIDDFKALAENLGSTPEFIAFGVRSTGNNAIDITDLPADGKLAVEAIVKIYQKNA